MNNYTTNIMDKLLILALVVALSSISALAIECPNGQIEGTGCGLWAGAGFEVCCPETSPNLIRGSDGAPECVSLCAETYCSDFTDNDGDGAGDCFDAECSAAASCQPANGQCASSLNSCTAGAFQDVTDTSTEYKWSCTGSNGGTTASCSQPKPVNGICSSTFNTCTAGAFQDTADSPTNYQWSCMGSNGGTTASCSLPKPVNGICSSTLNTCTAGAFQDTADTSTDYRWSCTGSNGGAAAACSLSKAVSEDISSANCFDSFDNDFDSFTDCADPACNGASCNDNNPNTINDVCLNTGICRGSIITESQANSNCQDSADNDGDGNSDYDSSDGRHGDDGCPVGVSSISFFPASPLPYGSVTLYCGSTIAGVNSIGATIKGPSDTIPSACSFQSWSGSTAVFSCPTKEAGNHEARCGIDTSKSFREGGDRVIAIPVQGGQCATYTTQSTCEQNGYKWCTGGECLGRKTNTASGSCVCLSTACPANYICQLNTACNAECNLDDSPNCNSDCTCQTGYFAENGVCKPGEGAQCTGTGGGNCATTAPGNLYCSYGKDNVQQNSEAGYCCSPSSPTQYWDGARCTDYRTCPSANTQSTCSIEEWCCPVPGLPSGTNTCDSISNFQIIPPS